MIFFSSTLRRLLRSQSQAFNGLQIPTACALISKQRFCMSQEVVAEANGKASALKQECFPWHQDMQFGSMTPWVCCLL